MIGSGGVWVTYSCANGHAIHRRFGLGDDIPKDAGPCGESLREPIHGEDDRVEWYCQEKLLRSET